MFTCEGDTLAHHTDDLQIAAGVYCRMWKCERCARMLRRKLIEDIAAGQPNAFVTLTAAPLPGEAPEAMAERMKEALTKWKRQIEREKHHQTLQMYTIIEAHKSGYPHMHILWRCKYIPQKWLLIRWNKLIKNGGVWIEDIRTRKNIVRYVSKYLGKKPHRFKGRKRYWRTLGWSDKKPTPEPKPKMFPSTPKRLYMPFSMYLQDVYLRGSRILELRPNYVRSIPPGSSAWYADSS